MEYIIIDQEDKRKLGEILPNGQHWVTIPKNIKTDFDRLVIKNIQDQLDFRKPNEIPMNSTIRIIKKTTEINQ